MDRKNIVLNNKIDTSLNKNSGKTLNQFFQIGFIISAIFFILLYTSIVFFAGFRSHINDNYQKFLQHDFFLQDEILILNKILKDDDFDQAIKGKIKVALKNNDNLFFALLRENFHRDNINDILSILEPNIDMRTLPVGQHFIVEYSTILKYQKTMVKNKKNKKDNQLYIYPEKLVLVEDKTIEKFYFKSPKAVQYSIFRKDNGYEISVTQPILTKKTIIINGVVKNNLFSDVLPFGIKASTLYNVLNEYSFLIDFQRDLRKNDKFIFIVDTMEDQDNELVEDKIVYFNLVLNNKNYEIFNFHDKFYDKNGNSIKKSLLKTPIDGARISSRFNLKRKHPILGYTRAHTGVDMAAPSGTPIYSAGDGVIIAKTKSDGYGNYIDIRHNAEFVTRYAHMLKFANVKIGQKVKQRQVIGYVGMTGLATGPHLHYEVIRNGHHINPSTIKVPSIKKIDNKYRDEFNVLVEDVYSILRNNSNNIKDDGKKT